MLQGTGNWGSFAAVSVRLAMVWGLALAACGGEAATMPPAAAPAAATAAPSAPALPIAAKPDVDLEAPGVASVRGAPVAFDGVEEGLAWPALDRAVGPRKTGDVLTVQVARGLPVVQLLRAAWTLRQADLRIQAQDATGVMKAVDVKAHRDGAAPQTGCHLAVFLQPDGTLRIAAPGGASTITGDDATATLARSLEAAAAQCPVKYVAFGAESDGAPFGPVFDVMLAVDANKSAGDARYVLGQALHAAR